MNEYSGVPWFNAATANCPVLGRNVAAVVPLLTTVKGDAVLAANVENFAMFWFGMPLVSVPLVAAVVSPKVKAVTLSLVSAQFQIWEWLLPLAMVFVLFAAL